MMLAWISKKVSPAPTPTLESDAHKQKRYSCRDKMVWIPQRCEVLGCVKTHQLIKCGKCGMVMYCGQQHLKQDRKRHRQECEHLQKLRLFGYPYLQDVELTRYPLGIFPVLKNMSPPSICGLCGKDDNVMKTPCCGLGVCNPYNRNDPMQSSHRRCYRSHMNYTVCGRHHILKHQAPDWRQCERCSLLRDTPYASNGYNFTPRLWPQKGVFLTDECSRCPARIHTTYDDYVIYPGGNLRCTKCSNTERYSFNDCDELSNPII